MRHIDTKLIYESIKRQALSCICKIDGLTAERLRAARDAETCEPAAFALDTIIKSNEIAGRRNMPACQDTGMALVFLEVGCEAVLTGEYYEDAVNRAVREAYAEGGFRMSVLDPLTRINTKDNTPAVIHTRIVKGDGVRVSFLAKGFGSENMSRLFMLTPAEGREGIIRCAVQAVTDAGGNPCPPVILGIGIGGTMEKAAIMAKESLLRELGKPSENAQIADLERDILRAVNETKVGAMGFGGVTTALAAHVLTYPTHIAGLPVAVNIQCHSNRHLTEEL